MLARKRADLPEMNAALLIVVQLISVVFAFVGTAVFDSAGGLIMALPFWMVSAAVYCTIFLLQRKFIALLVTPITGLCLWTAGYDIFCVIALPLSLLFVSLLAAVCLLTGKTRFWRMVYLSSGVAVLLVICGLAGFFTVYSSFSVFYDEMLLALDTVLAQITAAGNPVASSYTAAELLYTVLISLPAMLGVTAEIIAASVLFLSHAFLRFINAADYFTTAADHRITSPRSFGAISLLTLILTMLTSPYDNPFLYSVLSNILSVFLLPCAYVGIRELLGRMQKRSFSSAYTGRQGHRRFSLTTVFLIAFLILLMGLSTALSLSAALGAFYILRTKQTGNPTENSLPQS